MGYMSIQDQVEIVLARCRIQAEELAPLSGTVQAFQERARLEPGSISVRDQAELHVADELLFMVDNWLQERRGKIEKLLPKLPSPEKRVGGKLTEGRVK